MFGLFRPSGVRTVSPPEAERMARDGEAVLVDVRETGEWRQARIKGAVHLPLSRLQSSLDQLPSDKPVVFYCLSGARSAQAVAVCRSKGLDHDLHMAGGLAAWNAHGLPLVR